MVPVCESRTSKKTPSPVVVNERDGCCYQERRVDNVNLDLQEFGPAELDLTIQGKLGELKRAASER